MAIKEKLSVVADSVHNFRIKCARKISRVVNLESLESGLTELDKITDIIGSFREAKSYSKIRIVLNGFKWFIDVPDTETDAYGNDNTTFLTENNFEVIFDTKLADLIFSYKDSEVETVYKPKITFSNFAHSSKGEDNNTFGVHKFSIGGYEIFFSGGVKQEFMSHLWISGSIDRVIARKEILSYISTKIWQNKSTNSITLEKLKNSNFGSQYKLIEDELHDILPSAIAEELSEQILKFTDKNIHRTLMLFGPPGTGKSTAIRYLIHHLNMKSFRIPNGDVSITDTLDLIKIVRPDIVVIDDFDRVKDQTGLLDFMEEIKQHTKAFLLSANYLDKIDEAILRPGRIDDLVYVEKLDKAIIDNLLGPYKKGTPDKIYNWPISYIAEYKKRCQHLGQENALSSMEQLSNRIAVLKKKSFAASKDFIISVDDDINGTDNDEDEQ